MSVPNTFQIYDLPSNTNMGGGGFQELGPDFTAPTLAAASIVAQDFSTLFQRAIWLTQKYNLPSASYMPFYPDSTLHLTPLPSGISY